MYMRTWAVARTDMDERRTAPRSTDELDQEVNVLMHQMSNVQLERNRMLTNLKSHGI